LPHGRKDGVKQPERAEDVHLELRAPLREGHVLYRTVLAVTGVVDERVDASGRAEHRPDGRVDRSRVGDVELDRLDSPLREPGEVRPAARRGEDAVAALFP